MLIFYLGILCGLTGLGLLLYSANRLLDEPESQDWPLYITLLFVGIYGVGIGLKLTTIGPAFIRFHLSNFGLPALMLLIITSLQGPGLSMPKEPKLHMAYLQEFVAITKIAFAASFTYELLTSAITAIFNLDNALNGKFDIVDIAASLLGSITLAIAYSIAWRRSKGFYQRRKTFQ